MAWKVVGVLLAGEALFASVPIAAGSMLVRFLLTSEAALVWTAGFLPDFLQPSAASVLFAKPVPRWTVLLGKYAGVVINPATPASVLEEILPDVDLVLVMTVNPGFGGQEFIESMLPKIRRLRDQVDALGLAIDIEVDGGVHTPTAARCVACVSGRSASSRRASPETSALR